MQDFNTAVKVTTFGIKSKSSAPAFLAGHEHQHYVPPVLDHYRFNDRLVRSLLNWFYLPAGDSCLLLGPTGSGKSSVVEQVAGRLNWPTITVSAHSRMEMPELTGYNLPQTDKLTGDLKTVFVDGPLTLAMRHGYVFVLDEYDTLDPSVTVGLHAVMEGRPLVIAENGGEIIQPHPSFRFVACGNTAGQGDETGLYAATMQQNLASLDRFRAFKVGYMEAKDEEALLREMFPDMDSSSGIEGDESFDIIGSMVKIANSIRDQHQGLGGNYLSVTMSTRTLVRWAGLANGYVEAEEATPLKLALEQALLNRCDAVQEEAINQMARSVFGEFWDMA